MKNENEIISEVRAREQKCISDVCKILADYSVDTREYIAEIVASLCEVKLNDLYKDTRHIESKQARWLYWYAYRHMTKESLSGMSEKTKKWRRFAPSCIGASLTKMSFLISQNTVWTKRWAFLRSVIKELNKNEQQTNEVAIMVVAPQNVKVEIKRTKQ